MTTAPQPRFIRRPTVDRRALFEGVDRIAPDEGAAMFVQALVEAADRFHIAAESRIATGLPEIGEQVARSHALQSRHYLVVQRLPTPPGRSRATSRRGRG